MEDSYLTFEADSNAVFIHTKRELNAEECQALLDKRTDERNTIMSEIKELCKNEIIKKYDSLIYREEDVTGEIILLKERLGLTTEAKSEDGEEIVSLEDIVEKAPEN